MPTSALDVTPEELLRAGGVEPPLDFVAGQRILRVALGGVHLFPAAYSAHSSEFHEASGLVMTDLPSLALQLGLHFAGPVHAVVLLAKPLNLRD